MSKPMTTWQLTKAFLLPKIKYKLGMITHEEFSKKAIDYLKCDADNCIYVEFYEELTADSIGRKCQLCQSTLMTEESWIKFKESKKTVANV